MPLLVFRPTLFENTAENLQFRYLCEELRKRIAYSDIHNNPEVCLFVGNFNFAEKEFDAFLIKRNAIILIEFKNYGGKISISNNEWKVEHAGQVGIIKGGSGGKTPLEQVRLNRNAFIRNLVNSGTLTSEQAHKVASLVVFNHNSEITNKLRLNIQTWLNICDNRSFFGVVESIVNKDFDFSATDLKRIAEQIVIDDDYIVEEFSDMDFLHTWNSPTLLNEYSKFLRGEIIFSPEPDPIPETQWPKAPNHQSEVDYPKNIDYPIIEQSCDIPQSISNFVQQIVDSALPGVSYIITDCSNCNPIVDFPIKEQFLVKIYSNSNKDKERLFKFLGRPIYSDAEHIYWTLGEQINPPTRLTNNIPLGSESHTPVVEELKTHINQIFQALSLSIDYYVYDCLSESLPKWANHITHRRQFFICAPLIENINKLKSFIGKDINICEEWMYWHDGDEISGLKINLPSTPHAYTNELKTHTRLPSWLDDYIFKTLHGIYAPDHERFDYNLDLTKLELQKYLGTYFPRSYSEAFCIFDNLFLNANFNSLYKDQRSINIAAIGCGTGGDLLGLLTVLDKYSDLEREINIFAVDGNQEALKILNKIVYRYKQVTRKSVTLETFHYIFNNINSFDINNIGANVTFDFILCSKMICEVMATENPSNNNAYYDYTKKFLPLLNKRGIFYLLDVTTRQKHSTYNPVLMNMQVQDALRNLEGFSVISPIPCFFFNRICDKQCFYQKTFYITHTQSSYDKSKVAYKLIARKEVAEIISSTYRRNARYLIHNDNICPNTQRCDGEHLDAFCIPSYLEDAESRNENNTCHTNLSTTKPTL